MRRRQRAPGVAFALAALILLLPRPSAAQTLAPTLTSPVGGVGTSGSFGAPPNPGITANPAMPNGDLLQPSLQGSPNAPQRFRRAQAASDDQAPPTDKFVAPSRVGATPVYGSPNALGAGNTGFDSMNTPRARKKKPPPTAAPSALGPQPPETTFTPVPTYNAAQPNPQPPIDKAPPAEVWPKRSASRPGAALAPVPDELPVSNPPAEVHPLASANRPGAILALPPQENFNYTGGVAAATQPIGGFVPPTVQPQSTVVPGSQPQRLLPIGVAANDPFAPVGIRTGSFLLYPSLDLTGGYITNAERVQGGTGSPYFVAAPELQLLSDWTRHSLTADIAASYTQYAETLVPSLNVPYLNARVDGRVDVSRDIQLLLEGRALVNTDNPGSPNLQTELAQLPINTDLGATFGYAQTFGRLAFSLKGTFDDAQYQPSQLTNGTSYSNIARNFNQYAGILHVGYEIDPGMTPFFEVQLDTREHLYDPSRSSDGAAGKVGTAVDLFGSLTGAMALGYLSRTYTGPGYPNIDGPFLDGALIWQVNGLTTAKLSASAAVYETTVPGASGELSRDYGLEVDHAFRTWLIGIGKIGFGTDNYVGSTTFDDRWFVSGGIVYKFNREVQVSAQLRQDWLNSSTPTSSYTATSFILGLHLQR